MFKAGMDYEFFILVKDEVARARNLTRYTDGNCSTAEYRTNVIRYIADFQRDINKGMKTVARDIVSRSPLLTIPLLKFYFAPIVTVDVYYKEYDLRVPIHKTAGIHFHRSNLPARPGTHSAISRIFNSIAEEASKINPNIQKRVEALVPGPNSGTLYDYAGPGNMWRQKHGKDYYEFIAPPSSELLFNQDAIESVFRLIVKGNINDKERTLIRDAIASEVIMPVRDFIPQDISSDIYFFDLTDSYDMANFPSSYYERKKVTSWFDFVNIVQIPETGSDAIINKTNKHKFYGAWKKHTIGVVKSKTTKLIRALKAMDFDWIFDNCLTRMDKVFDDNFTQHLTPPIDFLTEAQDDKHYGPYYRKYRERRRSKHGRAMKQSVKKMQEEKERSQKYTIPRNTKATQAEGSAYVTDGSTSNKFVRHKTTKKGLINTFYEKTVDSDSS